MPDWTKDTWAGHPVIYMGDGKHSATFFGPDAEKMRDQCAAAPAMLEALQIALGEIRQVPCGLTRDEKIRIMRAAVEKAEGK